MEQVFDAFRKRTLRIMGSGNDGESLLANKISEWKVEESGQVFDKTSI